MIFTSNTRYRDSGHETVGFEGCKSHIFIDWVVVLRHDVFGKIVAYGQGESG